MKIPDARSVLSHDEIVKVTQDALRTGPFQIKNVRKIGQRTEVTVRFPKTGHEKVIILDSRAVTVP
jgi:hypothetical protein